MAKNKRIVNPPKSCRSLRAVENFRCIADKCENSCCHSWEVKLTKRDYVVWRNLAKKQPAELERFQQHVVKQESDFASIALDSTSKSCPFLGGDGLCGVHSNLGPEALPGTCRTFPRIYNLDKNSMRASASLGCPEYVRNVIASDSATDIVEVAVPRAGTSVATLASVSDAWHWQRCLPEIGELGLSFVKATAPRASLAERLFVVAMMMSTIEDHGNNPSKPLTLALFSTKISPLLDAANRAEVIDSFRELSVPQSNLSLQFIISVFAFRLTLEWQDIAKYWDGVFASYKKVIPAELKVNPGQSFVVDVDSIAPVFWERRRKLHARAGGDLQRWYTRAFCNQFYNSGAGADETPLTYFGRHILTLMMFDFAVCSHEDIDSLLEGEGSLKAEEQQLLKNHVVNIIHRIGRTVLHVSHISTSLSTVMQDQQVEPFALVTTMLKDMEGDTLVRPLKLNPVAAVT